MPSCAKFKDELIACLELSDCVLIAKKTVKECTEKQYADLVSKECKLKQQAYFECRINMLSPRLRFRGNYGGTSTAIKSETEKEDL